MSERYIGPHVSAAGSLASAVANAQSFGATAFALFVKNQRQWVGKALSEGDVADFRSALAEAGYTPKQVLPHAGYLINLANPDPEKHAKSMESFLDEMHRCEELGLTALNIHPGAHVGLLSVEEACDRVAESVNVALEQTRGVTVVIENTAGQGTYLGSTPEELGRIVRGVADPGRVGICLDTAHTFAAGFDIRTVAGWEAFLERVESAVGLRFLRGLHLNDSKGGLGTHLDRHASLGQGELGWGVFEAIARDERLAGIPLILETPESALWAEETRHLLSV